MFVEIIDDVIWVEKLPENSFLAKAIATLEAGETITLSVDGIVGEWTRIRNGRDSRPIRGVRPVGAMAKVWKKMRVRRGAKAQIDFPDEFGDALLKMADETFVEWYSEEDEKAYADL